MSANPLSQLARYVLPLAEIEAVLRTFLRRDRTGAGLRSGFVVITFLLYWLTLGLIADFPRVLPVEWLARLPFPLDLIADLATSLFAPRVLVHLIPVFAALWLAFRLGAHYLADLFELESFSTASRHVSAALFGLNYSVLRVTSSKLEQYDQSNPILRIGGPGYLDVHLGFAAVCEPMEFVAETPDPEAGKIKVYGEMDGKGVRFLSGFERLRAVVDLRNQIREIDEIRALTEDGIEVFARDVQMAFRVYGGGDRQRSLNRPFPYEQDALKTLIYGNPMTQLRAGRSPTFPLGGITGSIRSFVEQLDLDEFLALPDWRLSVDQGYPYFKPTPPPVDGYDYRTRVELRDLFYTEEMKAGLRKKGLELAWVGVGTWEIRDNLTGQDPKSGVGGTLIEAWRDLQRSKPYTTDAKLEEEFLKGQKRRGSGQIAQQFFRRITDDWKGGPFQQGSGRCWRLPDLIYHFFVDRAHEFLGDHRKGLPTSFEETLTYIGKFTEHKVLGGS